MRLTAPRPPLRFLILLLTGWVAARVVLLWPEAVVRPSPAPQVRVVSPRLPGADSVAFVPPASLSVRHSGESRAPPRLFRLARRDKLDSGFRRNDERAAEAAPAPCHSSLVAAAHPFPRPSAPPRISPWSGYAYVFARPGGGRSLAATAGQIGGAQAAARIGYRVHDRAAVFARAYTPLRDRGAEAAFGIDMTPVGRDLHLVVERRHGLDRAGREAWSGYAYAGLSREPRPGLVVDAYAQAGLVGAHRRDGFVDGSIRIGRRLEPTGIIIGAGLWSAAQPGASRLDAGPRIAAPLREIGAILSVEARLRIAGRARPGSGLALTLARDF